MWTLNICIFLSCVNEAIAKLLQTKAFNGLLSFGDGCPYSYGTHYQCPDLESLCYQYPDTFGYLWSLLPPKEHGSSPISQRGRKGKGDNNEVEFAFSPTGARAGLWFTCWVTLRVLANLLELVLLSTDGEESPLHNVKTTCDKTSSPWFTLHLFLWNLLFKKETFWFVPVKDCLLPLDAPNSVIHSLPCPLYWEEGGWCWFYVSRFLDL